MSMAEPPPSPSPDASPAAPRGDRRWRGFCAAFLLAAAIVGAGALGFVAAMDPYGLRAAPGRPPGPLMDLNQRFMYPQVVRSGRYDAAVFGTSTARLLDPERLDRAFGLHFANLAMNAATPWEQTQLARLFLRSGRNAGPPVRGAVFGLDATWCEAEAERRRTTFRPFPPWLYAEPSPADLLRQANWQALATASQVALFRLGFARARMRGDGYGVFTPPEASYDAARAAAHIHGDGSPLEDAGPVPARAAADEAGAREDGASMPALAWLDALLAEMPAGALRIVAFMPVHAAVQGREGTPAGRREADCKARVAAIGRARGATVVDFRIPSPITTRDENYWDALHYRLPVAARLVEDLAEAHRGGGDDPAGVYRVLARP